jgi:hypothetical protein
MTQEAGHTNNQDMETREQHHSGRHKNGHLGSIIRKKENSGGIQ